MKLNRIITLYQVYTTKVKVTDNIMHFPREGLLVDDSPSKTTWLFLLFIHMNLTMIIIVIAS